MLVLFSTFALIKLKTYIYYSILTLLSGEGNDNPLSTLAWTEEPGKLQSMGSQRVRHD